MRRVLSTHVARTRNLPNRNDDDMPKPILQITRDAIDVALGRNYSPDDNETLTIIRLTFNVYLAVVVSPALDANDSTCVENYLATFNDDNTVTIERIFRSNMFV